VLRIDLHPEEHVCLEDVRRTRQPLAERCHYVLLSHAGWSVPQIAQRLDRNEHTVRKWLKAYQAHGLAGLSNTPQPGRPATTGHAVADQLDTLLVLVQP
jgi:transposase